MSNINTHYLPDFEFFQIKIYKRNINFCEFFSLFSLLFNHVVEWPSQLLGSRLALRIIGLCEICLSVNSRWHQHRLCCCCWLVAVVARSVSAELSGTCPDRPPAGPELFIICCRAGVIINTWSSSDARVQRLHVWETRPVAEQGYVAKSRQK